MPVPPVLRRMRRHTSAPVIPPNAISSTNTSGLVCGLWQCSIATAGEPVLHMTRKSLETAEIIAHIASKANGSLSNTPIRIARAETPTISSCLMPLIVAMPTAG